MQNSRCLLCQTELFSGQRRMVHPCASKAAERARLGFFHVLGVFPEVACSGQDTIFACMPCFSTLQKGEKQIQTLESTVNEITRLATSAGILMGAGTRRVTFVSESEPEVVPMDVSVAERVSHCIGLYVSCSQ